MSSSSANIEFSELDLGSGSQNSRTIEIVSLGFAFASLAIALSKVSSGSMAHTIIFCIMALLLMQIIKIFIVVKSFTAIPSLQLRVKYSVPLLKFQVYQKVIKFKDVIWVRSRIDEYKEILIEVGNRGYKTTKIIRISYNEGEGLLIAEKITSKLAKLWNIENKGHNKFA